MTSAAFQPLTVRRATAETDFAVRLSPRTSPGGLLDLPNKLLAHFVEHFAKAAGVTVEVTQSRWPRSWEFDHVLCEDFGQLLGHGIAAIHAARRAAEGVPGRGFASATMDDAAATVTLSFEDRPRCAWRVPRRVDIDGFVDAWYGATDRPGGVAYGTNLRQFFDGFAYGSGASVLIDVSAAGNLHHLYEVLFRALGDAVGEALGLRRTVPGDDSGLAGTPRYEVREETGAA
jgi:imidazoleglycerol-phosphate dehydratase